MGEQTAEFENGKIVSRDRLLGGRALQGHSPASCCLLSRRSARSTARSTKQGEAEDNGEVLATSHPVEAKAGSYKDAVVTMDTSTVEPDVVEYKFYAPNVGPVLALDVSGGAAREGLVKIDKAAPGDGTGPIGKPNPGDLSGTCVDGHGHGLRRKLASSIGGSKNGRNGGVGYAVQTAVNGGSELLIFARPGRERIDRSPCWRRVVNT